MPSLTFADRCFRMSRVIHWVTVALMSGLLVTALFWDIDPHGSGNGAFLWHSSLGISVYLLSMSRLLLWVVYRPMRHPTDDYGAQRAGPSLRYAFYALLLALPLSGWLLASEEATPTHLFGMPALSQWFEPAVPHPSPGGSSGQSRDVTSQDTIKIVCLSRIHATLAAALSIVIAMHVFWVIRHRDGTQNTKREV